MLYFLAFVAGAVASPICIIGLLYLVGEDYPKKERGLYGSLTHTPPP